MKKAILSLALLASVAAGASASADENVTPGRWERLGFSQYVFWHAHYNLDTPRYGDRWKLCGSDGSMTGVHWNPKEWGFGVGCSTDSDNLYAAEQVRWQGIQRLDHPRWGDRLTKCEPHERMVGWKYNPKDWALEIACVPAATPQTSETIRGLDYGRLDAPRRGDRYIACAEGETAQGISMNPSSWAISLICANH